MPVAAAGADDREFLYIELGNLLFGWLLSHAGNLLFGWLLSHAPPAGEIRTSTRSSSSTCPGRGGEKVQK